MSVQKRVIPARPTVALGALVHIGPQQFFKTRPAHANQAFPAFLTRQYGSRSWSKCTPDLTLCRHLRDVVHRIALMNALSFDTGSLLKEKTKK